MKKVVILKTGETFSSLAATHGDFEKWIAAPLGDYREALVVVDSRISPALPDIDSIKGVIITGSHAMVTDRHGWSERLAAWLPAVVDLGVPLLGICYGHQLLAHAMGGTVADNPNGREFGTCRIHLTSEAADDPLFGSLAPSIAANLCHTQSVIGLPPRAVRLAASDRDRNQAFRIGSRAWGVQFHPEFDRTAMKAYIRGCANLLVEEGQVPEELEGNVSDTPSGEKLLQRFMELALSGDQQEESSRQRKQSVV